jgi:hypothetical protein
MPSELRHLVFRPAEVFQAVVRYQSRLGMPLPRGSVVHCGPEEGEAGSLRFRVAVAPEPVQGRSCGRGRQDFVLEGSTLAAALILHCRDRGIPLPANACKSLERFGEQVCLVATSNPRPDTMRSSRRDRADHSAAEACSCGHAPKHARHGRMGPDSATPRRRHAAFGQAPSQPHQGRNTRRLQGRDLQR